MILRTNSYVLLWH